MQNIYSFKKLLYTMVVFMCCLIKAEAQPCGLDAKITINCGTATCGYFADSSGYQPGWVGYKYEWVINDQAPIIQYSVPTIMYDQLGAGFNRVQLKVYGTNTITGDSCIDTYTNIFQATGDAIYPEFDVSVNGNTVTVNGTYKGGPFFGAPSSVIYDFGDGTQTTSNSFSETHTYANSGTKSIYLYVQMFNSTTGGMANGQTGRNIEVGPGVTNLEFTSIQDNSICDSVRINAVSSPAFTMGYFIRNFNVTGTQPVNGSYVHAQLIDVPGHDFLGIEGYAPLASGDITYYLVKQNDCGIFPDTVAGYVFEDLNYNGLKEPGEPGMPGVSIFHGNPSCNASSSSSFEGGYSTTTDINGYYTLLVPHSSVQVTLSTPSGYTLTFPGNFYYTANYSSGTLHSNHHFGLSALSTQISGRAYLDDNNDSLYTSGERPMPSAMLLATNTITGLEYRTYSGSSGTYTFKLPPGNFVIKPVNWPVDSATFTPDSLIVNAGSGGSFTNRNFGFRSPVPTDFHLTMSSTTEARPGFDYRINNRIYNSGYLKGKGDLVLSYDPVLTPLSVNPANGIINTGANTITWTTDSIQAGFAVNYEATFNIPSVTPLGTVLVNSATITALAGTIENDLSDNSYTKHQTVIGSFDPNDKSVFPEGIGATGDVLHDTRFDYLIRFQNTGTASAIHVFVADTIDDDLDLNTLVIHRASHAYNLVINGNVLTWRFFNINLPDSNSNEAASHGFIEYSISPKAGLADGTTIDNTAYIYFDFNAPVVTNATLNTMQSSLAATEEISSPQRLIVYPNPGKSKIFLLPRTEIRGQATLVLYEISGKKIRTLFDGLYLKSSTLEADVQDLPGGIYILELRHSLGVERVKWIRQ